MQTIEAAKRNHYIIESAARVNEAATISLWEALTIGGSFDQKTNDVLDTIPAEYAATLQTDTIAAVFAFECLFGYYTADIAGGFKFRENLREGWKIFIERAKAKNDIAEGFGWDKSASWASFRDVEKSGIDTEQVAKIAKLAGRMYSALVGNKTKDVLNVPAAICSVKNGGFNEISYLLPSELSLFANKDTESLVLMRLATSKATVYLTKGSEKKSKGALGIAIDNSGSMHGDRHIFASAAAIALSRVAREEKRPVFVVHFSTSVYVEDMDPNNPADIVKLITAHLSGGTDIARAIRTAEKKIREQKKFNASDLIIITDGIDPGKDIPDATNELLKIAKLFTVAIECEIPVGNILRDKAAAYIHLSEKDVKNGEGVIGLRGAIK